MVIAAGFCPELAEFCLSDVSAQKGYDMGECGHAPNADQGTMCRQQCASHERINYAALSCVRQTTNQKKYIKPLGYWLDG